MVADSMRIAIIDEPPYGFRPPLSCSSQPPAWLDGPDSVSEHSQTGNPTGERPPKRCPKATVPHQALSSAAKHPQ
jgi:hypothetical protein